MGTFANTTVHSDGGGNNRNSSGPGEAYDPLPVCELHNVVHTLTWVPGPNEQVVSEVCSPAGDTVDGGISIGLNGGVCIISGSYLSLFPTEFFEWTLPPPDAFTLPDYYTGSEWSELPDPRDSDLTQFDCHPVRDKEGTYTYSVSWVNTSSGATGVDTVVLSEQVYMDFWLHQRNTEERAQ